MEKLGKRRLSPSVVISIFALVVAMGGTAFAGNSDAPSTNGVTGASGVHFEGHAPDGSSVNLFSKNGLVVQGICNTQPAGYPSSGTALGIKNISGRNNGFADTTDDDDDDFDIGEGVMFNYLDGGDGGGAMLPGWNGNGHSVNVPNGIVAPAGSGLGSDCYFSGVAFFS